MFSSWTFREEMNLSRSYITDMMQKVSLIDIWPTNLVLLDVKPKRPEGLLDIKDLILGWVEPEIVRATSQPSH